MDEYYELLDSKLEEEVLKFHFPKGKKISFCFLSQYSPFSVACNKFLNLKIEIVVILRRA
jgi:hypothetical protein